MHPEPNLIIVRPFEVHGQVVAVPFEQLVEEIVKDPSRFGWMAQTVGGVTGLSDFETWNESLSIKASKSGMPRK